MRDKMQWYHDGYVAVIEWVQHGEIDSTDDLDRANLTT
jgi:hypothetical protein